MNDEQIKPLASYIADYVYQYLISKHRVDRASAKRAAINAANKAAQSLQQDMREEV